MTNTQERLTAIGFGRTQREAVCWRTVRLDEWESASGESGPEPSCSHLLLNWRKILRRDRRHSPYLISRIVD